MLIYAITTHVENEIESQWVDWMRETFIPMMFSTGKFREATFTKVVGASTDGSSYSVQYTTSNRTTLQNFLAEDAPRLETESQRLFGNKTLSFATELELIGRAQIKDAQ